MNFASYGFIVFLAVVFVLYFTVARRFQWQLLLAASVVFYAFSGWTNLVYILVTTCSVYLTGTAISGIPKTALNKPKRKLYLILCLVLNFGLLAVIKYADFTISNINHLFIHTEFSIGLPRFLLPLGMSFYTFQTMGYIIDVYWGKEAERGFFRFALFTMFFPQLIQGPISRYGDLKQTLYNRAGFDRHTFAEGINRVFWGFFKKMVIADRLMPAVNTLTQNADTYQGMYVLLAVLLYAIRLYADFTGGIDITIGIAKALNIQLKENFNMPFYSKNIAEYWRRWHITMGTWFKDYLFYPLSTSKPMTRFMKRAKKTFGNYFGKRAPVYLATLILWFMTGLWHGASWNFITWGLVNGIVIIISQELTPVYGRFHNRFKLKGKPVWNAVEVFRTFWLMCFIRAFDIYAGVGGTLKALGSIVINFGNNGFLAGLSSLGLDAADYCAAGAGVAVMIIAGVINRRRKGVFTPFKRAVFCAALGFCILIFGAYGFGYDATQFIYNQF